MAKSASSAKRTNRVISLLVALSFIGAGFVAGFLKENKGINENPLFVRFILPKKTNSLIFDPS